MNRFAIPAALLLQLGIASAQEHTIAPIMARNDTALQAPPFLFPSEIGAFHRADWTAPAPMVFVDGGIEAPLISEAMLQAAVQPDPNRSVRIYRSDPMYHRVGSAGITKDGRIPGVSPGPTRHSWINNLITGLYIGFRERIAGQNLSPVDYTVLPSSPGMLQYSRDCFEAAMRRGEEQTSDVFSRMRTGVWPYNFTPCRAAADTTR